LLAAGAWMLAACGPGARPAAVSPADLLGPLPPAADAPYELADDLDLAEVRHRYDAMAPGMGPDEPQRPGLRHELAAEYADRIDRALGDPSQHYRAYEGLLDLVSLWT